jgi:anti-sigma B factor antagonist
MGLEATSQDFAVKEEGVVLLAALSSQPDARPFGVRVSAERDAVRVTPSGELDLATVDQLDGELRELREAGFREFVLDLRELAFIDSAGLRLIIGLDALARHDGLKLALVPGCRAVQRVFELCGVHEQLPFQR